MNDQPSPTPAAAASQDEAQAASQRRLDALTWFLTAFVAVCAVVGAVAIARSAGGGDDAASSSVESTTEIRLSEYRISPAKIVARPGERITVVNEGSVQHDVVVVDTSARVPRLAVGESAELDLSGLSPGTYVVICSVTGHESSGMTAELQVVAGEATALAAGETGAETSPDSTVMDHMDMDAAGAAKVKAFPAKTEGTGDQTLAPTIAADGTKVFDITADEIEWEVEAGKKVEAMAYNGQIPGPRIQVEVGDKVRFVLHNELEESTAVHFHGLIVPNEMDGVPDITQPPIKPGETFTYEFTAQGPAVGMYHSHHDASVQVPAGLAGAFLVGHMPTPAGPSISQELVMMLNDSGPIGFSLNAKSFPATTPVVTKFGDRIMMHYFNEGETVHPMHLHGIPQTIVAKDGIPVPAPQSVDTVLVAPGERYTVVIDANQLGTWAWHCHILSHAERPDGMFGMVTALVVQ